MIPQRLNLVTLGVADVARARSFYEGLGWKASSFESDGIAFFEMNGAIVGLFGRGDLAEDAGVSVEGSGFKSVALAVNLASREEVDTALAFAASKGATITQPAREVFWGGYSGYFADPDGHLWEIAFNPVFILDEDGRVPVPPPAEEAQ